MKIELKRHARVRVQSRLELLRSSAELRAHLGLEDKRRPCLWYNTDPLPKCDASIFQIVLNFFFFSYFFCESITFTNVVKLSSADSLFEFYAEKKWANKFTGLRKRSRKWSKNYLLSIRPLMSYERSSSSPILLRIFFVLSL